MIVLPHSSILASRDTTRQLWPMDKLDQAKPFTMGSCLESREDEKGITPRTVDEVFRRIEEQPDWSFILRATYVEIYNEEIYDLFAADEGTKFARKKSQSITLREEKDGSILLCGVREEKIDDKEQLYLLLEQGSQRRSVGSTMMNDESSRSHAIFTLILEKSAIGDAKDFVSSRFSFVDLAGSERLGRTEAVGKSMKEGININKGLLALGNVISALTDDTGKASFVPYRVSKLTRILRNSLGGNSRTWMIACVSPVLADLDESLNTIKYATRARKISNTPIINKDPQSAIIAQLKQQVFKLNADVVRLKKVINQNGLSSALQASDEQVGDQTTPDGHAVINMTESVVPEESSPEWEPRFKAIERENIKLKEERNRVKKELNEKNVLYCKLISRVNDLRTQNAKLVATFQQLTTESSPTNSKDPEHSLDLSKVVDDAKRLEQASESEVTILLREVDQLKNKLAEKSKYSSTLEEEYTKLLRVSTRENELLVGKIKECSELGKQLRILEKNVSKKNHALDLHSSVVSLGDTSLPLLSRMSEDQSQNADLSIVLTETTAGVNPQAIDIGATEEDDQLQYEAEKTAKEEELRQLQASLEEKEAHLKQILERETTDEQTAEGSINPEEYLNLDKLTELEQQLMDAKLERDDAVKRLQASESVINLNLHRANTDVTDRIRQGRKGSDAGMKDMREPKDDLNKYKQKVSSLEQQIQDMRRKDKDLKDTDNKMKEKNSKIEHLQSEIQKMKSQRLELDKKLRDGSTVYAKTKLEKHKEIVSIKKELFKKTTEVTRLKNLSRKQDLSFHKKLAAVKKSQSRVKLTKKLKRMTATTFENIDVESFSNLVEIFCQRVTEHAEVEDEVTNQTEALLKYHSKLDELLTEISKLEAEKQTLETEDLEQEVAMLESKQKEFESNAASCEEAITIKRHFIDRLEAQLEESKTFLDEGFASMMKFLSEGKGEKEEFWETALNIMMIQLENAVKQGLGKTIEIKTAEANAAQQLKNASEIKRMKH